MPTSLRGWQDLGQAVMAANVVLRAQLPQSMRMFDLLDILFLFTIFEFVLSIAAQQRRVHFLTTLFVQILISETCLFSFFRIS